MKLQYVGAIFEKNIYLTVKLDCGRIIEVYEVFFLGQLQVVRIRLLILLV
jgi:hypothetical protein